MAFNSTSPDYSFEFIELKDRKETRHSRQIRYIMVLVDAPTCSKHRWPALCTLWLWTVLSGIVWAGCAPTNQSLAQQAISAAREENFDKALELFRKAYWLDSNPRWLYNMGVLYDRVANCEDAAFFYVRGLYGQGVLPADRAVVGSRLQDLEQECNFRAKLKLADNRHDRAGRYIKYKLCGLAEEILEGIMTQEERAALGACYQDLAQLRLMLKSNASPMPSSGTGTVETQ